MSDILSALADFDTAKERAEAALQRLVVELRTRGQRVSGSADFQIVQRSALGNDWSVAKHCSLSTQWTACANLIEKGGLNAVARLSRLAHAETPNARTDLDVVLGDEVKQFLKDQLPAPGPVPGPVRAPKQR